MTILTRNPAGGDGGVSEIDLAGGSINYKYSSPTPALQRSRWPLWSIYIGRQSIGDVHEHSRGRYAAVDPDGLVIGIYPSAHAARDAVLQSRRMQP